MSIPWPLPEVDVLHPVQIRTAGMVPASAQVREEVRANVQTFKPGGGYVFNNVHNIQAGVLPENVVAMYDAAYEFGLYG